MNDIKVFSSKDDLIIDRICEIFKERNISFEKSNLSNKSIYVSEEDYEKAKGLLDFLNVEEFEEERNENANELKEIKVDEFGNRIYSLPVKILCGIALMLCIFLLILLAVAIVSIIKNR